MVSTMGFVHCALSSIVRKQVCIMEEKGEKMGGFILDLSKLATGRERQEKTRKICGEECHI